MEDKKKIETKLSKIAEKIINQNISNECESLEKFIVDFTSEGDVVIYGIISYAVSGDELDCINKVLIEAKTFLKFISPYFEGRNIKTSIFTKQQLKKSLGISLDEKITLELKKFLNEETKDFLKDISNLLNEAKSKKKYPN